MSGINTFLLSIFTNNRRFGIDVESLNQRLQYLTIIYINLATDACIFIFNLTILYFIPSQNLYLMPLMTVPLSASCFLALRKRNLNLAAFLSMLKIHISNLICTDATNFSLSALYGIMMYPTMTMFLTPSFKLQLLNMFFCICEFLYNSHKVNEIYKVTLTEEQQRQITGVIATALNSILSICGATIIQKKIESNIWKLAFENHQKSEKLTKEVVQAMEAKDSFISMLSHEIRNPLNSLRCSIDYLLQVVKNQEHLFVLKNAKLGGEILLNLVNNVLDAAKLKSDKMEIIRQETSFTETLKKALIINTDNLKEKDLIVEANIDNRVPKQLWLDSSRMLQILMNLLSNSIKFTPSKGKIKFYVGWHSIKEDPKHLLAPYIDFKHAENCQRNDTENNESQSHLHHHQSQKFIDEFDADLSSSCSRNIHTHTSFESKFITQVNNLNFNSIKKNNWVVNEKVFLDDLPGALKLDNNTQEQGYLKVQIIDTGSGIPQENIPKLFGMFEQVAKHARSVHGGTGLGLWICKQLCQKMDGEIALYSKENTGTSFVFYIPVNNNQAHHLQTPINRSHRTIKALVVDDYSVNRYLHKLLLEQEGVKVDVTCSGKEALQIYKNSIANPYNLILMDIHMPEMDGFEAAKLIRKWELKNDKKNAEIYFVTGEYFSEEEVLSKFKSIGGAHKGIKCLRKPLDVEIIQKAITVQSAN